MSSPQSSKETLSGRIKSAIALVSSINGEKLTTKRSSASAIASLSCRESGRPVYRIRAVEKQELRLPTSYLLSNPGPVFKASSRARTRHTRPRAGRVKPEPAFLTGRAYKMVQRINRLQIEQSIALAPADPPPIAMLGWLAANFLAKSFRNPAGSPPDISV
ncbi:MAG: hypothetical protein Ct9H300mP11_04150 [Chloroflexota bacterium]|nr:MAG: hypothetical protein Ct9H300mP11_04150 [Chloroflexota bacterium]